MNKISLAYTTGATLYAVIRTSGGQYLAGATAEPFALAHWGSYALPLAELATGSGQFAADFPAAPAETYAVDVYAQAGASPTTADGLPVASGQVVWDGTAEVVPFSLDAPDAIGKGTLRQALRAIAAVLAGASFTEADNGDGSVTTSISDFLDAATPRISAVETPSSRNVTVL